MRNLLQTVYHSLGLDAMVKGPVNELVYARIGTSVTVNEFDLHAVLRKDNKMVESTLVREWCILECRVLSHRQLSKFLTARVRENHEEARKLFTAGPLVL